MSTTSNLSDLRISIQSIKNAVHAQRDVRRIKNANIPKIAQNIRTAFLKKWPEDKAKCQAILVRLNHGIPVPSLSVCGHGTQEIRYTKLLSHYLNPKSPHGLGSALLRAGFGKELEQVLGHAPDWDEAEVIAEYSGLAELKVGDEVEQAQLDIFIRFPKDQAAILIEQKIKSAEGVSSKRTRTSQLRKYSLGLEKAHPELHGRVYKVFLSPKGLAPKDDDTWVAWTHEALIERFSTVLNDSQSSLSNIARHNLASLLIDLICGPLAEDSLAWESYRIHLQKMCSEDSGYYLRYRNESVLYEGFEAINRIMEKLSWN